MNLRFSSPDLKATDGRNITMTGRFLGKIKYATPEQALARQGVVVIRTDLHALGVILYQILTHGAFPYDWRSMRILFKRTISLVILLTSIVTGSLMNLRSILGWIGLSTVVASLGAGAAMQPAQHSYHLGKAPKAEYKVAGKSYKIDPQSKSAKQIRSLPPEHFDPLTRRDRVDHFYHDTLKDHFDERFHDRRWHCGRFRPEFIFWVRSWRPEWRARWAWHHRIDLDDALWSEWMTEAAFANEINALKAANTPADPEYLPPEYAQTPPVVIYSDEYINAVFNPTPFLAVLKLKSLKADPASDWIASATADSLLSNLSSVPGLFVADQQDVDGALHDQKSPDSETAEPSRAAQIGKSLDVEHVVAGSYVADGDKVLFNLRIVNVKTGAVENGVSQTFPRDHLLDHMPGLASSIATMLGYTVPPSLIAQPTLDANETLDERLVAAPSAKRTFTATDALSGDTSFTAEDGPYDIQAKLAMAEGAKKCTLRVGAGADVRGGTLTMNNSLHVDIVGMPDRPAIFRHVAFNQPLGGGFKAEYAIFDDCTFHKTGPWYAKAGYSSKWEFDKCIIHGSAPFPKLTHMDYGIKFTNCTFIGATLADIVIPTPKDKPLDYMTSFRKDWRTIDHCTFENCEVPPTIFWCAVASNYSKCSFTAGTAFESDTPTDVVAFVANTDGDSPDKIALAAPPKRAALNIKYAEQPFDVYAFPPLVK